MSTTDLRSSRLTELQAEKEDLEIELKQQTHEKECLEKELMKYKKRCHELNDLMQNTVEASEFDKLKEFNLQLEKENKDLNNRIKKSQNELQSRDQEIFCKNDRVTQMENELEQLHKEKQAMLNDVRELGLLYKKALSDCMTTKDHLEAQEIKLEEAIKQKNAYQEDIEYYREELSRMKATDASSYLSERSFETLGQVVELRLQETEQKLIESEKQVQELQKQLTDAISVHKEETNRLKNLRSELETELANTKELMRKKDLEVSDTKLLLEKSCDEVKSLQQELKQSKMLSNELEKLKNAYLEEKNVQLEACSKLFMQKENLEIQLETEKKQAEQKLKDAKDALSEYREKSESDIKYLRSLNKSLSEEVETHQATALRLEQEKIDVEKQLSTLQKQRVLLKRYEEELQANKEKENTLRETFESFEKRIHELEGEKCSLVKLVDTLQNERDDLMKRLKDSIEQLIKYTSKKQSEPCHMCKEMPSLKLAIKQKQLDLQAEKEATLTDARNEIKKLQQEHEGTLQKYKIQVQQLRSQINEIRHSNFNKDLEIRKLHSDLKCSEDAVLLERQSLNKSYLNLRQQDLTQPKLDHSMPSQVNFKRDTVSFHARADEPGEHMDSKFLSQEGKKRKAEEEDLETDYRIEMLKRRNEKMPPHLRSQYAVEFQDCRNRKVNQLVESKPNAKRDNTSISGLRSLPSLRSTSEFGLWSTKKKS